MRRYKIILLSLYLCSCIEYSETMWINEDGSGKVSITASVDKNLLSLSSELTRYVNNINILIENLDIVTDTIKEFINDIDGLKYEKMDLFEKGGSIRLQADLAFESSNSLNEGLYSLDRYGIKISKRLTPFDISFKSINEDEMIFERKINSLKKEEFNSLKKNSYFKTFEALLSMYKATFTVHFPYQIISGNTSKNNIFHYNNKATWNFSLSSLMDSPQTINAQLSKQEKQVIASNEKKKQEIKSFEKIQRAIKEKEGFYPSLIVIALAIIALYAIFSIRIRK